MTDKELRKLSRLEMLELLLEASNENKELNEKIDRLEKENKTAESIENLSVLTRQIENTLRYANSITDSLKSASVIPNRSYSVIKDREVKSEAGPLTDKEIYQRMLCFFVENDDKLKVFPPDLENAIRDRIRTVLEKAK